MFSQRFVNIIIFSSGRYKVIFTGFSFRPRNSISVLRLNYNFSIANPKYWSNKMIESRLTRITSRAFAHYQDVVEVNNKPVDGTSHLSLVLERCC